MLGKAATGLNFEHNVIKGPSSTAVWRATMWLAGALAWAACSSRDQHLAMTLATPTPDARALRASALATIYAAAAHHDKAALLALLPSAMPSPSASASPDPAVELALMTLDSTHYERAFVRNYPTTSDALTFDYGSEFARARVVPSGALFPIVALGKIATREDGADAFGKLLSGASVTSGTIGNAYRAQIRLVIAAAPPAYTIGAFAALPLPSRLAAISSLGMCSPRPSALLAYRPTPVPAVTLQTAAPSPAGTTPAPAGATPLPTGTARPGRTSPTLVEVAAIQESIRQAVRLDCGSASASARKANRKMASPRPQSR